MIPEREIEYLSVDDVIDIHDVVLESMGNPYAPLRDGGVLAGAVARPQNAAHYASADLIRQACILIVAISEAQSFVEGNKRAGMTSALTFLEQNGCQFVGDSELLAVLLIEASGIAYEQAIDDIDGWMRPFVEALSTGAI